MSLRSLRAFVSQRLTTAVEEIMAMFEKTISEYEQELDDRRRLLGAQQLPAITPFNTDTGVSQEIQSLIVNTKIPSKQQELSCSLYPEGPEAPCIKEEPEEVWIRQGPQGPEEEEIPEFQFAPVSGESEDDEEKPLHHRLKEEQSEAEPAVSGPAQQKEAGAVGSEPALDLHVADFIKAPSNGQIFLSKCLKTETEDLDDDHNQKIKYQPFLDTQKDIKAVTHKRFHNQKVFHKCPACSKTFKNNTYLQRHITCHTGERPFHCTECAKTFRQKGSLHIHMRKHTGERPFSCLVCGKKFTQSGSLVAHIRIHTGERPFSCSVCKKKYNERGSLVRHMRVHTGEKPYSCSFCGKRFSEKGNLNKHSRIHTGESVQFQWM
ncbi:zinc finger protein 436-like [Plectropomus leopardus]|uniref:zinc finger protein 436-like n=1 Tax=Plectropomus leopardus TaxID=160734 RepID=UPI001C4D9153|nr:zinc finger protein 436-like [Plectropomus leopardus]